jgi:hypothetical protein
MNVTTGIESTEPDWCAIEVLRALLAPALSDDARERLRRSQPIRTGSA